MDIHGEFLDLTSTDSVNETSLTDTVAADQSILATFDELEHRVFQKRLASNDNSDTSNENVALEAFTFIVAHFRLRDSEFIGFELSNFLVKCVLCLLSCFG